MAVSAVPHDLGLTDRYTAENRFEVDGVNAARAFLKDRGIPTQQTQVVWDAIALHTTPSIAPHKEPEVAMTHLGITVDVIGIGLDRIPQDKQRAVLTEFPRLAFKNQFKECLCSVIRKKPTTSSAVQHPSRGGVSIIRQLPQAALIVQSRLTPSPLNLSRV